MDALPVVVEILDPRTQRTVGSARSFDSACDVMLSNEARTIKGSILVQDHSFVFAFVFADLLQDTGNGE